MVFRKWNDKISLNGIWYFLPDSISFISFVPFAGDLLLDVMAEIIRLEAAKEKAGYRIGNGVYSSII